MQSPKLTLISQGHLETEEIFGRDFLSLSAKHKDILLKNAVEYWRFNGFPYGKFEPQEIHREYKKIENTASKSIFSGKNIVSSTVGLSLANSFHPQMWEVRCQHHTASPIDHFNDDETLKKLLIRAAHFWPNRRCWHSYNIRNVFRIYSGGRVANFRPTASKAIIESFSKDQDKILDFCSGYGGRLLGSTTLNRHYTGIDVSPKQIKGLRKMYKAINKFAKGTADFHKGCAEEILPTFDSKSFDLVFTSPPYFNLEQYCAHQNQSCKRYHSYHEWKMKFLSPVIQQSHRVLKRNGFFVINIADTVNYPLAKDFVSLTEKYFKIQTTYFLQLNARPLQRKNGTSYKSEPVYILTKK